MILYGAIHQGCSNCYRNVPSHIDPYRLEWVREDVREVIRMVAYRESDIILTWRER